jgi:hypothetical protein
LANTENSGSTFKQWRKGISQARGKYIWIAESDDSADSKFLSTLVARLESNPKAVLAACCPRMTDLEDNNLGTPKDWFSDIGGECWENDFSSPGHRIIADALAHKNAILNASGVIFRNQEGLEELVDNSMRLCADWLFWVRLLTLGDFEYVACPLNFWRLNSSNARTRSGWRVLEFFAKWLEFFALMSQRKIDCWIPFKAVAKHGKTNTRKIPLT